MIPLYTVPPSLTQMIPLYSPIKSYSDDPSLHSRINSSSDDPSLHSPIKSYSYDPVYTVPPSLTQIFLSCFIDVHLHMEVSIILTFYVAKPS